ncbi:hypothetical protein GQ43DRAFT_436567 [Delitschia confertaspora ATCC 74209]|uniref:Uncharacterized protein n=1 Tax=Delitschia confertaspora ATCC 74209 TaxID=1513339 RepID=A0A9P4JX00_9PLEO|nr:hypothetical protein GQ43DRAFT_436567 [Delitschia confertaspora ATCC 74209]
MHKHYKGVLSSIQLVLRGRQAQNNERVYAAIIEKANLAEVLKCTKDRSTIPSHITEMELSAQVSFITETPQYIPRTSKEWYIARMQEAL